jgi:predicted aminopeptidase
MKNVVSFCLAVALILVLTACTDFGYYRQSVGGHLSIMTQRQPIETVLADPEQPEDLKEGLRLVLAVRTFAAEVLDLPVRENFATYADIDRPYAVWSVVAAPAYSLVPYEWCFPVAGCLTYRGYYEKSDAERYADELRRRGLDTDVYGVPAYSTLGWFEDPVLSSFVAYPDWALTGLIFHELAHQSVYADNDSDFNEAFASFVEQEGVRRWLQLNRSEEEQEAYWQLRRREEQFFGLINSTRQQLLYCYDGRNDFSLDERQRCKETAFAQMKQKYLLAKSQWDGSASFDRWFEKDLNNARFISAHTYRYYIPAFAELLRREKGAMSGFYAAAKQLAELPAGERRSVLSGLRKASIAANTATSATSRDAVK